jgi:O-antigen/teichoic acid export membrane protein
MTMVWLARLISPAEFGVASLAISFLTFARLFSDLAMGPALIRREFLDPTHTDVAFICVMTLATFAGIVVLLASASIARYFSTPQLQSMCWAIAILIPVHAALSIANALLSRRSEFKFLALSTLPGLILGYGCTAIFLAMHGFGAWSILIGSILQYSMTAAFAFARARYRPVFRWDKSSFNDLFAFSVGQSFSQIINQVALSADNFVVGRTLGMEALGLYGRAYKLMELPVNVISTALFKVLFPMMASIQSRKDRMTEAYLASLQGLITVFIPISVLLILEGRPLVLLILGSKWTGAVLPFQTLCASLTFRAAYRHVNLPPLIAGRTKRLALLTSLYAIWVLGGSIAAATLVGTIEAVAVAVSIAIFVHYLQSSWSTNRLLGISIADFLKLHLPGILLACVMATSIALVRRVPGYPGKSVVSILIDAIVVAAATAMCLYHWPRWFLGGRTLSLLADVSSGLPRRTKPMEAWLIRAARSGKV